MLHSDLSLLLEIAVNLAVTLAAYGAGPLLFSRLQQSVVSTKQYRLFCIVYTVCVYLAFSAYRSFSGMKVGGGGPALLWGWIFYHWFKGTIEWQNKYIQDWEASQDGANPVSSGPAQDQPASVAPPLQQPPPARPAQQSFHEAEKASEEKKVCGPLNPPERIKINKGANITQKKYVWITALAILFFVSLYLSYQQGHQEGHQEGYQAGYEIGYETGASDTKEAYSSPKSSSNVTVYITASGRKYHEKGCSYLSVSALPVSLKEANSEGYTPCLHCNPPVIQDYTLPYDPPKMGSVTITPRKD